MFSELLSSLAAPAFAALLFLYFLYRRSREINAAANDGTTRGDSGAHAPTGLSEMATSSGANTDAAAANLGTARVDSGTHTSMGVVPEMATSSGANTDAAAANHGMASGDSGTHALTGVSEMPTSSGPAKDAAANDGTAGGVSGSRTSTESHGMGTSSGYDFEVFLSYNRKDPQATFTSHLHTRFTEAGIHAFKDDKSLRHGEEFGPELLRAIKKSKILIPIFSKNYASSPWCLKELAQMIECKNNNRGQKIIPIFYGVGSEEVRCQSGDYGKAFSLYEREKRYPQTIITNWRDALKAVARMQGHNMCNREEVEFVKLFTEEVVKELKKGSLEVPDCLIDVDDHVDKIMEMIGARTSETRIIGIHGMGGIGKTTIARIIYNHLSKHFGNCCFLSNIREISETTNGIACLQRQLISDILKREWKNIRNSNEGTQIIKERLSHKKVLILLDDVDEKMHMDALAGSHDWFGKGSKLIITTRNKEVLKFHGVQDLYEVNIMDPEQSLQLFSRHVFRRDYPLDAYINQSKRAVKIAGGLPLALKAIGSLLAPDGMEQWDVTLKELENFPDTEVKSKLKISYEKLDGRQRHIFCDIACLFNGYDKDILVHFWRSQLCPRRTMKVLENKSLIKIEEDNKVLMHDQLRCLGRDINCQESNMTIEKQKRVWDAEEVLDLLRIPEGKKKVEALRVKFKSKMHYCFTYEDFQRLSNLKFLEVDGSGGRISAENRLLWNTRSSVVRPTNIFRNDSPLLPQMRWLSWHDIPSRFNIAIFSIQDVIILDLSRSEITCEWQGWRHVKLMKKLKVLDLTSCGSLLKTPIFSADSKLEHLILARCSALIEIDGSICRLKCLVSLDVSHCKCLQRLPDKWGTDLGSLEYLSLKHCESLERFPNSTENLKSLIELDISNTRIRELPDTLWTMGKLAEIKASTTYGVERFQVNIGDRISSSKSLKILSLRCAKICALPKLPKSLVELQLSELYMDTFPDLSNLTNLKKLELRFGSPDSDGRSNGLVEYQIPPRWIEKLTKLESLSLSFRCVGTSPTDLGLPPQLKSLTLTCPSLHRLPRLPSSLSFLHLKHCESLCSMEDLSDLKNLSTLQVDGAAISEIEGLGCLENLRDLRLRGLGQVLNKLRTLPRQHVSEYGVVKGELLQFLEESDIDSCESLLKLPDLSSLKELRNVAINRCGKLNVEAISWL